MLEEKICSKIKLCSKKNYARKINYVRLTMELTINGMNPTRNPNFVNTFFRT